MAIAPPLTYRKLQPRRTPSYTDNDPVVSTPPFIPPPVAPDRDDSLVVPPPGPVPVETSAVDPSLLSVNTRQIDQRPRQVAASIRPRAVNAPVIEAPPYSIEYEDGRPMRVVTDSTDPDTLMEAQRALKKATDDYIPQKERGWKRYLYPILRYGLGAAAAGVDRRTGAWNPAAAGGGAIVGALEGIFNPRAGNQVWKAQKQAQVNAEMDQTLKQRKEEATISNLEDQPWLRRERLRIQQAGLDTRGQRVDDLRVKNALDYYNKIDYEPGANPSLDKYFAESGLHDLPPRKRDDTYQVVWSGGQLLRVPKRSGEATAVTVGGQAVTDPSKVPNQSVTINNVTYDHLTPKEAAILQGRAYEGAQNRASRERVAAQGQAGQDRRTQMNINARQSGVLNPTLRGAIAMISRFRGLTTRIETAKSYGDQQTADALETERNGLEETMRAVYGDILQNDDKGKPTVLNEAYTNPPDEQTAPAVDLTGQSRSLSEWRKKYPNATVDQEAKWKANVAAAGGTVIK